MKFFTHNIIQFIENKENQPKLETNTIVDSKDNIGDISRFIFTNQSIEISISKVLLKEYSKFFKIIPEMDYDIRENQKFYDAGVAFCECDCSQNKIFITEKIFSSLNDTSTTLIPCMVYAANLMQSDLRKLLSSISQTPIIYDAKVPKFLINKKETTTYSFFKEKKYYPLQKFIHHASVSYSRDVVVNEEYTASILYLNIPFEIYSECLNNMHHLNYNLNYKEFMCLRKSLPRFNELSESIQKNGLQKPITFQILENNLVPIENSSKILMAILLKLPIIPAAVYCTQLKFKYNNMYKTSKNTSDKLNKLFYPYFYLRSDKTL